jgi:hypothetical protein
MPVYCRDCGRPVPADARYCPSCGAEGEGAARREGISSAWIILAFLLFPPLGLLLMWTASRWSDDTKWFISGLFFTPLWMRFLWRQQWAVNVKLALLALFVLASLYAWFVIAGLTAAVWMTIVTVVALWFIVRAPGAQPRRKEGASSEAPAAMRRVVQARLESCHDLIAQIEGNTVLDFFPLSSPARQMYLRALEARSEAMNVYEQARTAPELEVANMLAGEALSELKAAQDALWSESPQEPDPPTR